MSLSKIMSLVCTSSRTFVPVDDLPKDLIDKVTEVKLQTVVSNCIQMCIHFRLSTTAAEVKTTELVAHSVTKTQSQVLRSVAKSLSSQPGIFSIIRSIIINSFTLAFGQKLS